MKLLTVLVVGAVFLVGGHARSAPGLAAPTTPLSAEISSTDYVTIISATYGSGTNFADVTSRVTDLLRQSDNGFYANPEWLKADPTPGWNKALVIVYEFQGQRHLFTAGEGGQVTMADLLKAYLDAHRGGPD
jgi:hypothetical protein